uniref:Endonuclease/exonuclease/phosphatase domain-containing protein n=1 Tax=Cacopsylla melanoneura TaxID=428564 RepID=A0A8D8Z7Y4_9HEMI
MPFKSSLLLFLDHYDNVSQTANSVKPSKLLHTHFSYKVGPKSKIDSQQLVSKTKKNINMHHKLKTVNADFSKQGSTSCLEKGNSIPYSKKLLINECHTNSLNTNSNTPPTPSIRQIHTYGQLSDTRVNNYSYVNIRDKHENNYRDKLRITGEGENIKTSCDSARYLTPPNQQELSVNRNTTLLTPLLNESSIPYYDNNYLSISVDDNKDNGITQTTKRNKNSLEISYQNVRGLRSKTNNFYENILGQDQDIIAITESWLKDGIFDAEVIDSRYQVFRLDRDPSITGKKRGGGLLMALKTELKPEMYEHLCIRTPLFEVLWIHITLGFTGLDIGLVYLETPTTIGSVQLFLNHLQKNTRIGRKNVLLLGDFNIPKFPYSDPNLVTQDPVASIMINFITQYSFTSYNNIPNEKNRTLDLVLLKTNDSFNSKKTYNLYLSRGESLVEKEDKPHPPLIISIQYERKNKKLKRSENKNHTYNLQTDEDEGAVPIDQVQGNTDFIELGSKNYNFWKVDAENLQSDVANTDWSKVCDTQCPNESLSHFYQSIYRVLDKHVPQYPNKKRTNKQSYPSWWTQNTIKIFKTKETLRRNMKRNNSESHLQLKSLKQDCKRFIKQDDRDYIKELKMTSH